MPAPRMRVIAGPNGSGKSTIAEELLINHPRWVGTYVNADDIERKLMGGNFSFDEYKLAAFDLAQEFRAHCRTARLLQRIGAGAAVAEGAVFDGDALSIPTALVNSYVAGTVADFIRHQLLASDVTFTFETVMSDPSKIEFMSKALECGYRTYLYFVATSSAEINVDRVRMRVLAGGHPVPEDRIRSRYNRTLRLLHDACSVATRAFVFDNSGDGPILVAEVNEEGDLDFPAGWIPAWLYGSGLIPDAD
jgi:predicted ABC-type ATPase